MVANPRFVISLWLGFWKRVLQTTEFVELQLPINRFRFSVTPTPSLARAGQAWPGLTRLGRLGQSAKGGWGLERLGGFEGLEGLRWLDDLVIEYSMDE